MAGADKMTICELIKQRYGSGNDNSLESNQTLTTILNRSSCRKFSDKLISEEVLHTLFATAFSAPSKSDLQQVSVIRLTDKTKVDKIAALSPNNSWLVNSPVFMVWCGDNRRLRQLARWREHDFVNNHLDAFMNAAVDAGIAMQTFIIAAEAIGLGCCPVSGIREYAQQLSEELALPQGVFPLAGLCVGWPENKAQISQRLPMTLTVHENTYNDEHLIEQVTNYDRQREIVDRTAPNEQRLTQLYGECADYGWSENVTRQYSQSINTKFGEYIKAQGFNLI